MEKEIPMDPLVNENTGEIEGYQLKISFDFPDNTTDDIKTVLTTGQPDNTGKITEKRVEQQNDYHGGGYLLYQDPDDEEPGENEEEYGNGDPYSGRRRR